MGEKELLLGAKSTLKITTSAIFDDFQTVPLMNLYTEKN